MQHPSRKCAYRRELNSHDAAEPRASRCTSLHVLRKVVVEQVLIGISLLVTGAHEPRRQDNRAESSSGRQRTSVPHQTSVLHGKHRSSVSSSGRYWPQCQPRLEQVSRRLEYVVSHGQQRGAGGFSAGPHKITGPWQARRLWPFRAVLPNPSLKRSANGRPPGPATGYGVHFPVAGPGVLPSSPA